MHKLVYCSSVIERAPSSGRARSLAWLLAGCAACAGTPVLAQSSESGSSSGRVGDIIVTARKIEERLQDVPLSVGVLQQEAIEARDISTATGLGASVAGLSNTPTGTPGGGYTIIRGSTSPALPNPSIDAGTGFYIDGVNLPRNQGVAFQILDIERIEVLRGPQGTLSGRNHSTGAISFATKPPTNSFEGSGTFTVGNLGKVRGNTILNVPFSDTLATRFTVQYDKRDGYVKNLTTIPGYIVEGFGGFRNPRKFGDGRESLSVTAKARYTGIDGLTADYKFDWSESDLTPPSNQALAINPGDSGAFALFLNYGAPGSIGYNVGNPTKRMDAFAVDFMGNFFVDAWGHQLTLDLDLNENMSLKSITSYRRSKSGSQTDNDAGEFLLTSNIPDDERVAAGLVDFFGNPLGDGVFSFAYPSNKVKQKQFSQELQLSGVAGRLQYVGGVYYFWEKARGQISIPFGKNLVNPIPGTIPLSAFDFLVGVNEDVRNESIAAYAHADFDIVEDALTLSVGGRYTEDKRRNIDLSGNAGPQQNVKYKRFNWDAALRYNFTPDANVYFRYANAYNAGGIVRGVPFRPEESDQFEIGFKADLFDRRLRANAAAYYLEFKDKQVGASNFDPTNTSLPFGLFVLNNDGKTVIKGFELEMTAVPVDRLTLTSNLGYNDPRSPQGSFIGGGRQKHLAPKWNYSFSAQYDVPEFSNGSYVSARVDADYRSKYWGTGLAQGQVLGTYSQAFLDIAYPGLTSEQALAEVYNLRGGGYWMFNANLAVKDIPLGQTKLDVSAFMRNAFDKEGVSYIAYIGSIIAGGYERPREYGLEVKFSF